MGFSFWFLWLEWSFVCFRLFRCRFMRNSFRSWSSVETCSRPSLPFSSLFLSLNRLPSFHSLLFESHTHILFSFINLFINFLCMFCAFFFSCLSHSWASSLEICIYLAIVIVSVIAVIRKACKKTYTHIQQTSTPPTDEINDKNKSDKLSYCIEICTEFWVWFVEFYALHMHLYTHMIGAGAGASAGVECLCFGWRWYMWIHNSSSLGCSRLYMSVHFFLLHAYLVFIAIFIFRFVSRRRILHLINNLFCPCLCFKWTHVRTFIQAHTFMGPAIFKISP